MFRASTVVPTPARSHWLARVVWSIASQALSSATNFGLTVLLAVTADAETFGRTVAALSVYLFALTLGRALVTERLVAAADGDRSSNLAWTVARNRLLVLAAPAAAATGIVGLVVGVDRLTLVVVLAAMPMLLVQDGQRYGAWATGRPGAATGLDAWWLCCSVISVWISVVAGPGLTPGVVVAAWAVGGAMSWFIGRLTVEPGFTSPPAGPPSRTSRSASGGGPRDRGHPSGTGPWPEARPSWPPRSTSVRSSWPSSCRRPSPQR